MNQFKNFGLLASAFAACLLAGCSDDGGNLFGGSNGKGKLAVEVDVNNGVISSRASRAFADDGVVAADDLGITLSSSDGSFSQTWPSIAAFEENPVFPIGHYTIEAFYGDSLTHGFDHPYFYGSADIRIRENETTAVGLTASLAHSIFTITYGDGIKNYMTAYSAELIAGALEPVAFAADETRAAYVKAGSVDVYVSLTKPNGTSARLLAATVAAEKRHHYFINIDINGGGTASGDPALNVTFDDALQTEDVTIELSDELMNAPAPEVTTAGCAHGEAVQMVSGFGYDGNLDFNIMARGGLKQVKLATAGANCISANWPAEIDLLAANAATQQQLKDMGLNAMGLWSNPDKMAVIRLGQVVNSAALPAGVSEATIEFALTVVDKYGKTSEPATMSVEIVQEQMALAADKVLAKGIDTYDLILSYNGINPAENVTIQSKNNRGTWDNLAIVAAREVAARGMKAYVITVAVDTESDYTFRATNKSRSIYTEEVSVPRFDTGYERADEFATCAYYTVSKEEGTLFISADRGATYTAAAVEDAGAYKKITGLQPGTAYSVMVSFTGEQADGIALPGFTTEAAPQLYNSGMDQWWRSHGGSNWNFYHPYAQGAAEADQIWDTMNEETTSSIGVAAAYTTTSGTKPSDDGSYALVRTVGWGAGNTAGGSWSVVYNVSAGQLYLGSFKAVKETPNYGIAFASRPAQLKFRAKYAAYKSDDYGTAEANVIAADGTVLASGSVDIGTGVSDWKDFTFDFDYSGNIGLKAASLQIIFKSTGHPNGATKNYLKLPAFAANAKTESVGGQLSVDDIQLIY